ncbi:hypothetical protein AB3Z09_04005 [Companilactobacillus farciminis]|uniref:hypothetical protein n=1 Tax=Companilactobacillus farciminis TaxID=1612 RepID=UPI0034D3A65C
MAKNEKGKSYKEISLFENSTEASEMEKKPRDKSIPAGNKNTDASASVFGWRFQIVAAIIFSLMEIEKLKYVEIEGSTEDIELYFNGLNTEYIQAKAIQKNPLDAKDNKKAKDAMNTLINTSNITKGRYSKLVYVANFRNPLNLKESLLNASWMSAMNEAFIRPYTSLPREGRDFIDKKIKSAQKDLGVKYLNTLDYFDLNRLYISTILLNPDDQDNEQLSVLSGTIEKFLADADISTAISRSKIDGIKGMLVDKYLSNAGSKEDGERHKKITKEILIWRIIFELLEKAPGGSEDIPFDIESEVEIYEQSFIQNQSENGEIANKILGCLSMYTSGKSINRNGVNSFINEKWSNFKEIFPLDDDEMVQEYGIKSIMQRIIYGRRTINKIKGWAKV